MNSIYRFFTFPLVAVGIAVVSLSVASAGSLPIRALASMRDAASAYRFDPPTGPTAIGHSHNDFAQAKPLESALEEGYSSVEVDVTDRGGEVSVVHLGVWTYGTLRTMYLDRLQRLVDEKGSIYGDGKKFTLWIEMRPLITGPPIVPFLKKLLASYPMFTVFGKSGKVIRPGPVEAVLINNFSRDFFEGRDSAPACLGTSGVDTTSAPNEPFECWAYMNWGRYFDWDGEGEMPSGELGRLKMLQQQAHARGLRTRFWGVPDTVNFWGRARSMPFDIVGTDNLKSTMGALRGLFPTP